MTNAKRNPVKLSFSHMGIHVHDLDLMEDFYTRVLGFTVTDRGFARGLPIVFTSWDESEHHQVVLVAGRPDTEPYRLINQMSFRVENLEEVQTVWHQVKDEDGVSDVMGINHGNAWALYFRDPEGNRLEIFCDTPWYISQPCIESIDLAKSANDIRAESEAFCQAMPGFQPIEDWRAALGERIAVKATYTKGIYY